MNADSHAKSALDATGLFGWRVLPLDHFGGGRTARGCAVSRFHPISLRISDAVLASVLVLISATLFEPAASQAQPAVMGKWSPVFGTQNVMIHCSVLPNGKVLFWGRRETGQSLSPPPPRDCVPRIWDPNSGTGDAAFSKTANTPGYNLFCSGHAFLPDGRLFVAGGHIEDGKGEPHATIYDPSDNSWHRVAEMSGGRWYPTVTSLPDGSVLVSFGTNEQGANNITQQIWKNGIWTNTVTFDPPPYFPRMHVVSDGRVFMSGPLPLTQFLDTSGGGNWTFLRPDPNIGTAVAMSSRLSNLLQEYAPSVLYDKGKIAFVGGGNCPLSDAERLDLTTPPATWIWQKTDSMHFARRQHNAVLLPDGTILVLGGTQGCGAKIPGEDKGFNDLTPGAPIHAAELWDPGTGHWTVLAEASVDRCYHSTAVLLPDATVLSAGGGEYSPKHMGDEDLPEDTHKDAQIFFPPYLFRGDRPDIKNAPAEVSYEQSFTIDTSHPDQVSRVTWIRLSSVTHSNNMNQRINFLPFAASGGSLTVTAPTNASDCPPGHYMLFLFNKDKVPSIAKIVRIH